MPKEAGKPKVRLSCFNYYYHHLLLSYTSPNARCRRGLIQCAYLRTDHAYIRHIYQHSSHLSLSLLHSNYIDVYTHVLTSPQRKAVEKAEKAKGRPTKAKKDKNAPKRALSAYMFFSQDWRERIKTENPDAGFG
jgi:hypothetical protein